MNRLGKKIRPIHQDKKRGIGPTRNAGLQEARGDFVAMLDHDDMWLPDKLRRQMDLAVLTEADVLASRCVNVDPNDPDHSTVWPEALPDDADGKPVTESGLSLNGNVFYALAKGNFLPHSTIVLRRTALEAIGGYAMNLNGVEDIDLWMRLAAGGYRFGFVDAVLVKRRIHEGQASRKLGMMRSHRVHMLERFLNDDILSDDEREILKKRAARERKVLGDYDARRGDWARARRHYTQAMGHGMRPAQALSWLATFLGPMALPVLRGLNRGSDVFEEDG